MIGLVIFGAVLLGALALVTIGSRRSHRSSLAEVDVEGAPEDAPFFIHTCESDSASCGDGGGD